MENHGKTMENQQFEWENHGKTIEHHQFEWKNYGKLWKIIMLVMGQPTMSMFIFNSYVSVITKGYITIKNKHSSPLLTHVFNHYSK